MKDYQYYENYFDKERKKNGCIWLFALVILIIGIGTIAQECRQKKVDEISKGQLERIYGE